MSAQGNIERLNVRSTYHFLHVSKMIILAFVCMLSGCASMGQLDAPPDWCIAPANRIEAEKEGDDAVQKLAETKQELARERSKRRCLQRYAKAVSG